MTAPFRARRGSLREFLTALGTSLAFRGAALGDWMGWPTEFHLFRRSKR